MSSPEWEAAFDALVSKQNYPMYVVTAAAAGERNGCLVGFATQCSIAPPAVLVCISKANRTYRTAQQASTLVVHFLAADDEDLARLFGEETGDNTDKFERCQWSPGPGGAPLLAGCRGWVAGQVLSKTDVGDHVAFALRVTAAQVRAENAPPFAFQRAKSFNPGHPA